MVATECRWRSRKTHASVLFGIKIYFYLYVYLFVKTAYNITTAYITWITWNRWPYECSTFDNVHFSVSFCGPWLRLFVPSCLVLCSCVSLSSTSYPHVSLSYIEKTEVYGSTTLGGLLDFFDFYFILLFYFFFFFFFFFYYYYLFTLNQLFECVCSVFLTT